jgi:hypothetical protein
MHDTEPVVNQPDGATPLFQLRPGHRNNGQVDLVSGKLELPVLLFYQLSSSGSRRPLELGYGARAEHQGQHVRA